MYIPKRHERHGSNIFKSHCAFAEPRTSVAGRYTPGTITAIPYIIFGILFLRALILERREEKTAGTLIDTQAAVSVA